MIAVFSSIFFKLDIPLVFNYYTNEFDSLRTSSCCKVYQREALNCRIMFLCLTIKLCNSQSFRLNHICSRSWGTLNLDIKRSLVFENYTASSRPLNPNFALIPNCGLWFEYFPCQTLIVKSSQQPHVRTEQQTLTLFKQVGIFGQT